MHRLCTAALMGLWSCWAYGGAVTWTGPANGQWSVAANWSGGAVPEPGDSVTISGATVSLNDARTVSGTFTLTNNALLIVAGAAGSFAATGPTFIDNGQLHVTGGAFADLSNATAYNWSLCEANQIFFVSGEESLLDLSGLQTMSTDVPGCGAIASQIFLTEGATLDLSGLETISAPGEQTFGLTVFFDSTADFSSLISAESMFALVGEGTTLDLPVLATLNDSTITTNETGIVTANALTTGENLTLFAVGNEPIQLDSLMSLDDSFLSVSPGSVLTLPNLTVLTDTQVTLSHIAFLNLPELVSIEGVDVTPFVTATGVVVLTVPKLVEVTNTIFAANLGAVLNFPALDTYTWNRCDSAGSVPFTVADGSRLNFPALRTFRIDTPGCGPIAFVISAASAGRITFSALTTIATPFGQLVSFFSTGAGTIIDLSALVTFNPAHVTFLEASGGVILRAAGGGGGTANCGATAGPEGNSAGDFAGDYLALAAVFGALLAGGKLSTRLPRGPLRREI